MNIKPSNTLLIIVLVLVNLASSAYIAHNTSTRISEQNNCTEEIAALNERIDALSERLDILVGFVESRHGVLQDLHDFASGKAAESFETGLVTIGVISATSKDFEDYVPYVEQIIEPDLNYLSWRRGSDIFFDFEVRDAHGQAAMHLEEVQYLHSKGINLIIGGMWSSQACVALSYCNDNGIILFSPSSESPLAAIQDDNLFRLAPTAIDQAPIIAKILHDKGVEAVVLIHRRDSWADAIHDSLEEAYALLGGVVHTRIIYPGECAEFSDYLEEAEAAALEAVSSYGYGKVAVELVSFSEDVTILQQAKDYPTLYNLTWYGSDGNYDSQQLIDEAPVEVEHLKLYTLTPAVPYSEAYRSVVERYGSTPDNPFTYYRANSYDVAMILGKAVIEAGSIDPQVLKPKIAEVAEDHIGITGLCRLNEADDRYTANYGIYSYCYRDGELGCWQVGLYSDTGEVDWFEE